MYCYYLRNKHTGEEACIFGYSWNDAKRRTPALDFNDWVVELRTWED